MDRREREQSPISCRIDLCVMVPYSSSMDGGIVGESSDLANEARFNPEGVEIAEIGTYLDTHETSLFDRSLRTRANAIEACYHIAQERPERLFELVPQIGEHLRTYSDDIESRGLSYGRAAEILRILAESSPREVMPVEDDLIYLVYRIARDNETLLSRIGPPVMDGSEYCFGNACVAIALLGTPRGEKTLGELSEHRIGAIRGISSRLLTLLQEGGDLSSFDVPPPSDYST